MKKLPTLVFAVSVFFCQSRSISIKYMETVDISSEIDAMEMPDDLGGLSAMFIKQLISSSMDKPSQFELLSNNEETIYQKTDSETDNENSNISMTISGNNDIIYTNYKEKSYTQQSDFMSRKFLINGELPQYDWVLTEETEKKFLKITPP